MTIRNNYTYFQIDMDDGDCYFITQQIFFSSASITWNPHNDKSSSIAHSFPFIRITDPHASFCDTFGSIHLRGKYLKYVAFHL